MNNLTTRKIVLGLLIVLVLAFSVQGIADAADLPLSKTSGDLQTISVGDQFVISFNVGIRSNTTGIFNAQRQLIDDGRSYTDRTAGANAEQRIDGQGYQVTQAGNRVLRLTNVTATSDLTNQPDDHPVVQELQAGNNYEPYTGVVRADSGRNAYNTAGMPLYFFRAAVEDDPSTTDVNEAVSQSRIRATITQNEFLDVIPAANRYHYNEERIEIQVDKDPALGAPFANEAGATMTFKLDASGFQRNITDLTEAPGTAPNAIPRSVTLICTPADTPTTGTYKVRIIDETPGTDTLWRTVSNEPKQRAYIEFTLNVVDDADVSITAGDDDIFHAGETLRIDNDFTVSETNANALIHYEVLSGPGTIFERTSPDDTTTPVKSHLTSTSAQVYLILNNGNSVVRGSISGQNPVKTGAEITYTYTGTGARRTTTTTTTTTTTPQTGSLNITVSGTGATRSVTVNAVSAAGTPTAIPAVLTGTATSTQTIITGTATEITLPTTPGSYTLTATASVAGYTPDTETITVAGPTSLGTISISQIGTPTNGVQTFSITVRRTDGTTPAPLTVTVSGTGFTSSSVPTANGSGAVNITLPTTAGLYTLTARATGYTSGPTSVRIAGTGQQQQQQQPAQQQPAQQQPTVSEPDSISIIGPSTRSGTVNEELEAALIVQVLDDDGDGLEGARVFYRVTGRGRISDGSRGGRSVGVVTDDDGYARANFTPTDGGSSTVRVNTDDVSRIVTFTITTGSAPTPRGPGTGVPSGTSVSPVVHVAAASRPPMLWVDGGAIYALVGASPQRFAASVDNALNITVGGGKVYWTEKTGESGGTINSANLNGSDVTELTSIKAVPMGIAVDVAGSKLYWTNSRGRIQSADLDGSGITNVMQNLPSPMDLALAGGNAYWTQGNGSVRFVNLRGQKVVRNVSTGTDTPGSLVIGGGKVYWTEMTGESGGTVNSANLNGTGATPLASILAAPMGIAVDGSRSKLYWTNSRGRVQSANLDGSGITNVVSGLGSPGDMVLSNSIAAPAATTTTRTTTTASNKYDVNGDGSVNNADSDAITVAIAAGATDAKYDVNGDGTVNVFDLVEIIANRDPGAAGAPTLFGMKMSAAQIDLLQEQIDLLIATNDRSPAALRTLIYLQQLLVTARPEKTLLLANYPNPFNPETWIPYELATDTNVRITIYNTQGVVIRTLQFGHQSAGYYAGRDRAAYWDGRNSVGEQVASGLYFYQLETDEMSLMRKMVILK